MLEMAELRAEPEQQQGSGSGRQAQQRGRIEPSTLQGSCLLQSREFVGLGGRTGLWGKGPREESISTPC